MPRAAREADFEELGALATATHRIGCQSFGAGNRELRRALQRDAPRNHVANGAIAPYAVVESAIAVPIASVFA